MPLIRKARAENETIGGEGVLRIDGRVIFVPGMMRGETGDVEITKEGKRYSRGKLVSLHESSPDRIVPECPYYGICGGCTLSHMTREHELSLKKERVFETLTRIGGYKEESYRLYDTVSGKRYGYRNKAELLYREGIGFGYVGTEDDFVHIESCLLLPPEMNRIISSKVFQTIPELNGAVIRTNKRGESMLILKTGGAVSLPDDFLRDNGIVSLWRLESSERPVHALDGSLFHLAGSLSLEDEITGLSFRVSPLSFFQINRDIAERLYRHAVELADLEKTDIAVDAYCGVGAIGMLAAESAGSVIGVEIVPDAVADAKWAAETNGIDNILFMAGKCENLLPIDDRLNKAKAVFLDPPRKGCGKELLDAIAKARLEKIVYISCDPATLARDIGILRGKGYVLSAAYPYDMFPATGHVETVCCLYHQKKDFISVPYEPKNADYLNDG